MIGFSRYTSAARPLVINTLSLVGNIKVTTYCEPTGKIISFLLDNQNRSRNLKLIVKDGQVERTITASSMTTHIEVSSVAARFVKQADGAFPWPFEILSAHLE